MSKVEKWKSGKARYKITITLKKIHFCISIKDNYYLGAAMAIQENGTESLDYFSMLRGWALARSDVNV